MLAVGLDLLLLFICLSHLPALSSRAQVPFDVAEKGDLVLVGSILDKAAANGLERGDQILTWDSRPILISEYLEFAGDRKPIGSIVHIGYRRAGAFSSTDVVLIPYYTSLRLTIITAFVGLAFWLIGIFILFSRPDEHIARILHWCIILMATTIFLTQARIVPSEWFSLFNRNLMLFVYPMAGAAFFYFSTLYPTPKFGSNIIKGVVIFAPAVFIAAICISWFTLAARSANPVLFQHFQSSYDACHLLLFLYGVGTVASMIYSYIVAQTTEDRRKLQWIMWGFAVGPTPYLALIIVPDLLFSADLVPEEYATLFLVVVPLTLAISFLRYQILDIGVLINRSVVYAVLTVFIGSIYVAAVLLVASAIGGKRVSDEYLLVVALSLIVAVVLNPLRHSVQRFVNDTLFPARSRYRELARTIISDIHGTLSIEQLFERVVPIVQRVLPVSAVALYSYRDESFTLMRAAGVNPVQTFQLSGQHAVSLGRRTLYSSPNAMHRSDTEVDSTKGDLLTRLGFSVGAPLVSESGKLLGILLVNPRHEARRFGAEEIDLLVTIARQVEEAVERLQLQERLILEREEKKRAEELNSLKSNFVSSVSHELRTPLTSIRMFADTLRETITPKPKQNREYLDIIVGETDRLARLINNVLDFSKIEGGLKEFHFADLDCHEVVDKSVNAMRYQIEMNGGTIHVRTPKQLPHLNADVDALEEVLVNLLSNALKYSAAKKEINLTVTSHGNHVDFAVTDKGIGIPAADLPHVFERFFRVRDERSNQVGGAGIGLAVVQHIVAAHKGTVTVQSKVGKGSTFVVRLPVKLNKKL